MELTLYLETTIVSYLTARPSRDVVILGHQAATQQWWEEERERYRLFISPFVIEEAKMGDVSAAGKRMAVLEAFDALQPRPDIQELAGVLHAALGLPERARADALHLAYTVHYEIDYLLTWNCAHLANGETLRRLAVFVRDRNLWLPIILTPDEMITQKELETE